MKKFTFMWFIQNYSYCWHEVGEKLESPTFFAEMMQETSWNLMFFPRGIEDLDFMNVYLKRCDNCNGPERIAINFKISLFDVNGKVLVSNEIKGSDFEFEKSEDFGFAFFSEQPKNNLGQKNNAFSSDILRVCCTMWISDGKIDKEDLIYARTQIALEKVSFHNTIENFGTLKHNEKRPLNERSLSKDGLKLSGNFYVQNEPGIEEKVMVEIFPESENGHLITCQIYLLSSDGKEVECGKIDIRNYASRIDTFRFPINLGNNLLDKKLAYLANDNLALRCECTLSTGIEFERIEKTFYDLQLTPFLREKLHDSNILSCLAEAKSALDDFKNLYENHIFTDVELKTVNKAVHAHKFVLCARSPVFRDMLTTDLKEKILNCAYIQVDDLDDSTIDQFLLFLYTDVLEDLRWESAMKLYYAAEKYQVQRLKAVCSSFLISSLDVRNFNDLLILADSHQDSDLKIAVENFICNKNKQIFCTDSWESFMETDPQLAMKTMHFYLKNSRN